MSSPEWDRLCEKMYRCDRAVGLLRDAPMLKRNREELIAATLNLLNEIRLQHNEEILRRDLEEGRRCQPGDHVFTDDVCRKCGTNFWGKK
jgi:hypothetical protein